MPSLIDRLPELVQLHHELLPMLEANLVNPDKDKNGTASKSLAGTLRFLAVAEYCLKSDAIVFKKKMDRVGALRLSLFERKNAGQPIDNSYLSMLAYKELFCALSSGNEALSSSLALVMGGRSEIEKSHDHPFDRAFGYALKSVVLNADDAAIRVAQFRNICEKKENRSFFGYALALDSILERNNASALEALAELLKGHKKLAKGRSIFAGSEDEIISVWGVGIVNLMKFKGLSVIVDDELIPRALT